MTAKETVDMMAKEKAYALEICDMKWVLGQIENAANEQRHWTALRLYPNEVEALRKLGYGVTRHYCGFGLSRAYTKPYSIDWDKVYDNTKKWWQFWR